MALIPEFVTEKNHDKLAYQLSASRFEPEENANPSTATTQASTQISTLKMEPADCTETCSHNLGKKGKVLPTTGHEGPEGEQMYSSTLPSTLALDGGGWSTQRLGRLTPGKDPVPIV